MTWLDTIILSVVEGITEFLPISSTGHMILVDAIMNNGQQLTAEQKEFKKLFEVCIQLGAILSVVVLYWKKFLDVKKMDFYFKLIVAVFPALVFGKLFSDKIDELLESPTTVAVALLVGGIILLFVDKLFAKSEIDHEQNLSYKRGFMIGMWQVIAMIPGTSRSAATIIGGMQQGLSRRFAAEFSFFLAVPTMMAATGYKLLKAVKEHPEMLKDKNNLAMLGVGNVIAFVVAFIAIKTFIQFLQKNSLRAFGVYRIVAAVAIFVLMYLGYIS
ncbi:MAG: undecaprenyl-diphosphate phosphatase [Flavipsychrobacter sp.]|nr:undecaprenyl-diphosphate phosphatase [Flavipsychrobacter sp.]